MAFPLTVHGDKGSETLRRIFANQLEVAMRKKIFWMILIGLALVSIPKRVLAQDTDKVVILSPRVGTMIDASERDHFHLFPQIKGFNRAVVYETPGKTYYIVIVSVRPNGTTKQTIVPYRENELLTLAEQIDHFEDLEKGTYQMGQQQATLRVVGRQDQVVEQQSDLLPFALKTNESPLESFPQLGVGVGISASSLDPGGIAVAFNAIEEKYRKQGYTIIHQSLNLDPPMQYRCNLTLRLSQSFALLVDVGRSFGTGLELKTVSARALYCFRVFEQRWVRPFAGGGILFSHFSIEKEYGDQNRISPIQSSGVYDYLESVSAEGGNIGLMLDAGIDLMPSPAGAISVYLNYVTSSTAEATVDGIQHASVKFGGLVPGVRLSIYF
jgi:hypothetical protein